MIHYMKHLERMDAEQQAAYWEAFNTMMYDIVIHLNKTDAILRDIITDA